MTYNNERIYYMDNVRALAMLLGLFFHAAIAYGPLLHDVWIISDRETSWVMDYSAWFTHLFRMPLFFIVAGFFANLLLQKRGTAGLLKNRLVRIVAPFIVFWPILVISMLLLFVLAAEVIVDKPPIIQLIADSMNDPNAESLPPTTMHLWFLYQLMYFYIITAIINRFSMSFVSKYVDRIFSKAGYLFFLPLLLVPSLFVTSVPLPSPEQFYPQLWSTGFYGFFFLFGWVLFSRRTYLDLITPYWKPMLGAGIVLYTIFYLVLPTITIASASESAGTYDFSLIHITLVVIEAHASVFLSLAFLVLGKKYLDISHAAFRYIADASYWVYLIHIPVLFLIQIYPVDPVMSIWLKFLISSLGTLGIGLLSYALIVRYTPIGWLLNGRENGAERWHQVRRGLMGVRPLMRAYRVRPKGLYHDGLRWTAG